MREKEEIAELKKWINQIRMKRAAGKPLREDLVKQAAYRVSHQFIEMRQLLADNIS